MYVYIYHHTVTILSAVCSSVKNFQWDILSDSLCKSMQTGCNALLLSKKVFILLKVLPLIKAHL